jgi:hypothetical protein
VRIPIVCSPRSGGLLGSIISLWPVQGGLPEWRRRNAGAAQKEVRTDEAARYGSRTANTARVRPRLEAQLRGFKNSGAVITASAVIDRASWSGCSSVRFETPADPVAHLRVSKRAKEITASGTSELLAWITTQQGAHHRA